MCRASVTSRPARLAALLRSLAQTPRAARSDLRHHASMFREAFANLLRLWPSGQGVGQPHTLKATSSILARCTVFANAEQAIRHVRELTHRISPKTRSAKPSCPCGAQASCGHAFAPPCKACPSQEHIAQATPGRAAMRQAATRANARALVFARLVVQAKPGKKNSACRPKPAARRRGVGARPKRGPWHTPIKALSCTSAGNCNPPTAPPYTPARPNESAPSAADCHV
jgi:hypothetical protein